MSKISISQKRKIKDFLKMKRCRYCGSKENLTIDHKTPLSRGGTNEKGNIQCLCFKCNRAKSSVKHSEIRRIIFWYENLKASKKVSKHLLRKPHKDIPNYN
ncbi:MAG: endonuclease [Bacteroidota bacterium]|jgi:5-methylcytosine-specific restriction endonuclease McrA